MMSRDEMPELITNRKKLIAHMIDSHGLDREAMAQVYAKRNMGALILLHKQHHPGTPEAQAIQRRMAWHAARAQVIAPRNAVKCEWCGVSSSAGIRCPNCGAPRREGI